MLIQVEMANVEIKNNNHAHQYVHVAGRD